MHCRGFSIRQDPFYGANGFTKCGPYLLASSLAAALLDGHFEHPAAILKSVPYGRFQWWFMNKPSFSAAC